MKMYGKSEECFNSILSAFERGEIPGKLSQIFIHRCDDIPCNRWSMNNQLLTAIHGTSDARGFNQWKEAGRKVKKGGKAFSILMPLFFKEKNEETGKESSILYGFKSIPVFAIEETEVFDAEIWEKAKKVDENAENWLKNLPLKEVADAWNIDINSYNGKEGSALGYYKYNPIFGGGTIALGVQNLSTWAHELNHVADHKNSLDTDNRRESEIIAEMGGAVLLEALGYTQEADRGGAWEYITSWSHETKEKTITICNRLTTRICKNVDLIIKTAQEIQELAANKAA